MKFFVLTATLLASLQSFADFTTLQCHLQKNPKGDVLEMVIEKKGQDFEVSVERRLSGRWIELAPSNLSFQMQKGELVFTGEEFKLSVDLSVSQLEERDVLSFDQFGPDINQEKLYVYKGVLKTEDVSGKIDCLDVSR
jgi:hypothetical protein